MGVQKNPNPNSRRASVAPLNTIHTSLSETSFYVYMLKATNNVKSNPNSVSLFAFKPRQVVLAEHHRTKTITMSKTKTKSLTQEQKTCLLHSVVKYLENNALSKTLKRILSEAEIEVCVVVNFTLFSFGLCLFIYLFICVCVCVRICNGCV